VIKKNVNNNARKGAKSTGMIDYVKSNDSMMWIHPWQNERQRSVNDSWSCILGNLGGDRLRIVINELFAAILDKRDGKILPAPS